MEMFNFSDAQTVLLDRSLRFIHANEADLGRIGDQTLVIQTNHFSEECGRLANYFADLGLEHDHARLVFNPARDEKHRILINADRVRGNSWLHALVNELIHLANLDRFNSDHGNVYRLTADSAIQNYYYEFLLWTRFQAMKIATRVHALAEWHERNGSAVPQNGCYQFSGLNFRGDDLRSDLDVLQQSENITVWREKLWDVLEEMSLYLGGLAFYQRSADPRELDDAFPAAAIEQQLGLDNCLALYALLRRSIDYENWLVQKKELRKVVVAMQEHGRHLYESGN